MKMIQKVFKWKNLRKHSGVLVVVAGLLVLGGCSTAIGSDRGAAHKAADDSLPSVGHGAADDSLPSVGLGAYTKKHAMFPEPPDRIGGAVTITAIQEKGSTRTPLPGPRNLDPAVFGTPENPLGWEKTPFPLVGIPQTMRQTNGDGYTIVDHATPFGDWMVTGEGTLRMSVTDLTAHDGMTTKDKIDFEATWQAPDKSHDYRVVANTPLPHGKFFPTFGGVVTDHLMHGSTGIGTKLMPTMYAYVSFWAKGDFYTDGRLVNPNQLIHVMITEPVRGDKEMLGFDGDVGGGGTGGKVLHLMIPPYKIGPNGPEKAPLKTGFIPFPMVKERIMADKQAAMKLPPEQRKAALARVKAVKELMGKTKKHVLHMMEEGKMFGQPFFHVMFAHVDIEVK